MKGGKSGENMRRGGGGGERGGNLNEKMRKSGTNEMKYGRKV